MRVLSFDGVPARDQVEADEVHLWRVALDVPMRDATLSEAERERAARFRERKHAQRYVAAHVALRAVIARYRADPEFTTEGAEGKPIVIGGPAFNLTHTDDTALIAVHGGERVGVDLERPRPLSDFAALAAQYFTVEEAAAIERQRFFTVWTRKEAALKATGDGLTADLRQVQVGAEPDAREVRFGRHTLNVESFSTPDGLIGALAVGPARKIARLGTFDAGCVTQGESLSIR